MTANEQPEGADPELDDEARSSDRGALSRAIGEALDGFAAVEVRDRIVSRAMELSGLTRMPRGGTRARELIEGLEVAVTEALGWEAADSVSTFLEPFLAHLSGPTSSGVRRKGERSTPVGDGQRDLLVASFDRNLARELAELLRGVRVHDMDDIFALLQAVESYGGSDLLLLIDGRQPMFRTGTIVSFARVLPKDARVVLWAVPDEVYEAVEAAGPEVEWVRVAEEAALDELAWLCRVPRSAAGHDPELTAPGMAVRSVVLLVDDDRAFREAVGRLLRACNFDVMHAADADEALAVARARRPDVVLTDQNMPGTSGLELADALRITMRAEVPPIVLVTAADVDALDTSGVQRVVRKPVAGDRLVAIIEELVAAPITKTG